MAWHDGLSDKQTEFVKQYLIDLNATQAAIRAGYSEKTARQIAQQNLSKLYIQDAIAKYREHIASETDVTPERIIAEYAKLAFIDPRKFYDDDGELIAVNRLPADVAAALSAFEVNEVYDRTGCHVATNRKIKFSDKKAALDSLARTFGMFVDKTQLSGKDGAPLVPVVNLVTADDDDDSQQD